MLLKDLSSRLNHVNAPGINYYYYFNINLENNKADNELKAFNSKKRKISKKKKPLTLKSIETVFKY